MEPKPLVLMCNCCYLICQTLLDQIATLPGNNIDSFLLNFRSTKNLLSEVEKKIFVQAAFESDIARNIKYRFVQLMSSAKHRGVILPRLRWGRTLL